MAFSITRYSILRYTILGYTILRYTKLVKKIHTSSDQMLSSVIRVFTHTFYPITQTHTLHINTKKQLIRAALSYKVYIIFYLVLLVVAIRSYKLLRMGNQQQLDGLYHQLYLRVLRNLVGYTIQPFGLLQFSFCG